MPTSSLLPDIKDPEHSALIIIDVQNDFMPGGPLGCDQGEDILSPLSMLLADHPFARVVATQDWHPANHVSFASQHPGKEPFDYISLHGYEQTLWPDHCIRGSQGAQLHPSISWTSLDLTVRIGNSVETDAYSAFRNNPGPTGIMESTGLGGWLKENGIASVYLCGLARDVSVLWSAEDAVAAGFDTHFLWDLTRPITFDSGPAVRQRLHELGVTLHEQPLPMAHASRPVTPLKFARPDPITKE